MGVDHIFCAVGNDLAAGKRVEHAIVAHSDAVIHGDCVKFLRDTACLFDFARDELTQVLEVHVTRDELGEGVYDSDDGLAEIVVFHACGAPEAAGSCHVAAVGAGA